MIVAQHGRAPQRLHAKALPLSGNLPLMRRVGAAMFLLGSLILLGTLPLPDPDRSDHPAIAMIAGLLALAALFLRFVPINRRWILRAMVIYGILIGSALVAVTRPSEAAPLLYLWPALFSAYFFTRRELAFDLSVMWLTLGVALFGWSVAPLKAITFMGVGITVSLTAATVMVLRERLSATIAQLGTASNTDYLTGLCNRRLFDVELQSQIDRALRSDQPLALVLFDLDRFKQVNDRFGHAAGDRALRAFAALLAGEQRSGDTLARIGGEEFAAVLFAADLEQAVAFAERIGRTLARVDGGELSITTSAGVAALDRSDATPSALLVAADRALYDAKAGGRERVVAWRRELISLGEAVRPPAPQLN